MATRTAGKSQQKSAKSRAAKASAQRAKPAGKASLKAPGAAAPAKAKAKTAAKAQKAAAPKQAAKAPEQSRLAKKAAPNVKAAAKKTAPAKAPAKKAAPKKAARPAAEKAAKKAAPGKPAPQKAGKAAQPALSAAPKPAKAKAAAPKKAPPAPAKKAAPAKKKPETPEEKKPLVGQKPRSPKPSEAADFTIPQHVQKASHPVNETPVKASPASAEAKLDFKVNDHIVYPAHGVGRIVGIEKQTIAGVTNELFVIDFEQEKMKLRVPTAKAKAVGMRPLSDAAQIKKAIETLKGRARIKRTMWSRRAQEYEAKINSGDINAVAEVVRDLYRASDQPEQSYSERQLFEAALDRLAREVAAVNKTDLDAAIGLLEAALQQKRAA